MNAVRKERIVKGTFVRLFTSAVVRALYLTVPFLTLLLKVAASLLIVSASLLKVTASQLIVTASLLTVSASLLTVTARLLTVSASLLTSFADNLGRPTNAVLRRPGSKHVLEKDRLLFLLPSSALISHH